MAGNVEPQITPHGINNRPLVDFIYQVVSSIQGICAKLDLDGGVTDDQYTALSFTPIFNAHLEDSNGNVLCDSLINSVTKQPSDRFVSITPRGYTPEALSEVIYQIFDMFETLTEQLDTDSLQGSNYEALVYTAHFTWLIENCKGTTLGNGTTRTLRCGSIPQSDLIDIMYAIAHSLTTLTAKLDADTSVTGTDYTALWYTATILGKIENSAGSLVGNAPTEI